MPYNPAATFDPSLITRSGSAIAGAITDAGQHFAQIKKQDKAAKALYDALEPEEDSATGALKAHPLGLTKDAFNSLSSQDRIAKISGFVEAEALKSARRKEQMAAEEMRLRAEELGLRKQEIAERLQQALAQRGADTALERMMANSGSEVPAVATPGMFGGPVAPGGRFGKVTAQSLANASRENPRAFLSERFGNVDNLMRALNTSREQTFFQPNDTNFALPNVPGMLRVPTGPNTAVILADPTKAGQTVAITGPNGEQMGFGLPTRSGVTPLNTGNVKDKDKYTRLSKQLNTLIEAQGKVAVLGEAYSSKYQPQIDALVEQLQSLEGGSAGGGGTAADDQAPTATNPKTGERLVFKNGKWQPLK